MGNQQAAQLDFAEAVRLQPHLAALADSPNFTFSSLLPSVDAAAFAALTPLAQAASYQLVGDQQQARLMLSGLVTEEAALWRYSSSVSQRAVSQAFGDLEDAVRAEPSTRALYEQALLYFQQENNTLAIGNLTRLLEAMPDNSSLYYLRGASYERSGLHDLALSDLNQAVRRDPANARAYWYRGRAYEAQGKVDLALVAYDQAVSLAPDDTAVLTSRAALNFSQRHNDAALADFTRLLELEPDDVTTLRQRAILLRRMRDLTGSLADYTRLIELQPQNPNFYVLRARHYTDYLQDYAAAIADATQSITLHRFAFNAYLERARSSALLGDWAQADRDYAFVIDNAAVEIAADACTQWESSSQEANRPYDVYPPCLTLGESVKGSED
jgi:tetratricopeptide (TPR) repeat protein